MGRVSCDLCHKSDSQLASKYFSRLSTDLVPQSLRGNNGDLISDALVGFEVEGQAGIVALDEDFGALLHGLSRGKD